MTTISPLASVPASSHPTSPKPSPGLLSSVANASAFILATLVFFSGCSTIQSPLDLAARTLTSTVQSVDKAMHGFTTADALGLVSAHDQTEARKLYKDYQAAEAVAETAITTAIQSGDTGSLAATTAALNAASGPLLKFLARFTNAPPQ